MGIGSRCTAPSKPVTIAERLCSAAAAAGAQAEQALSGAVFEGFANVWTPLMAARRLGSRPVRVELAGEAVVLFRGRDGSPSALIDRCPHRGAALSLGRIDAEGRIECPYHGWRFDGSGTNCLTPLNPEARRERLGATPLPVQQVGDLLWVYTAPGVKAPRDPVASEGLTDPDLTRVYLERHWACHWTRAMENMLDSPHLPFVHHRTIGRPLRRIMRPQSSMQVSWEETDWGGRARASIDGGDNRATLEFHRPNMMALTIPIPGRRLQIHALVIPVDAAGTRLIVAGSRDFLRLRLLNPLFSWINGRIADEDKPVVESTRPSEIPQPDEEHSLGSDQATLQFRRYYYRSLRPFAAAPPGEPA